MTLVAKILGFENVKSKLLPWIIEVSESARIKQKEVLLEENENKDMMPSEHPEILFLLAQNLGNLAAIEFKDQGENMSDFALTISQALIK